MINWMFIWSSKRPPVWESTLQNMNVALSSSDYLEGAQTWYPPVNYKEIPGKYLKDSHKKLKGQLLDQFENEAFKFVIESNKSEVNPDHALIIKPHLYPDVGLNNTLCKTLDLDLIYSYFKNYQWVSLGLFFTGTPKYEERAISLAKSSLYGRNFDNKLVDLETGIHYPEYDYLSCVTYINFRQLKDPNIIVATLNPHLVSVPHLEDGFSNKHVYMTLDTYDTSLKEYLIQPSFDNCKIVDNHIFVKKNTKFKINLYNHSLLNLKYDKKPKFPVDVNSPLQYEQNQNEYSFTTNKDVSYIQFKIQTGSLNDKYNNVETAGYTNLEYIVIGE